jgi:SAM-dependent MidA family methyltransferase
MPISQRNSSLDFPVADAAALRHSAAVETRVREEIAAAGGWLSFARYQEIVLYAPGLGYYVAGTRKFGTQGDFTTAPEMTSLFGRTLAHQLAQILGSDGEVLELGAGSGRLAVDVLRALQALDRAPQRYRILEVSAELAQRQRRLLAEHVPKLAERVEWLTALPERLTGVVLANEVLDALPVHVLSWRENGLFERGVTLAGGRLAWGERPADGELQAFASKIVVDPPFVSEVAPRVSALVASLAQRLERGVLLFLDYGFGRSEYYHPQRSAGTLLCHYQQRVHDDPFLLPGLQDISTHVDFTAVAEAGAQAGLRLLGYTTQAQFLINCGITRELAATPAEHAALYLPQAAAAHKLLSPAEMGELFKAIALGRGIEAPLLGFSSGDKSRLL